MAIQFQRLITPGEGVSTLMDFAPLAGAVNDGITGYYDNKRRTAIGAAAQQGNAAAAQEALRQGELDTGAQYQRLAQQDTDRATQSKERQIKILGAGADAALAEKDPARAQQIWNAMIKRAGVNPADMDPDELDFRTGPQAFKALAGKWQDPRESQLMDLKIAQANKTLAEPSGGAPRLGMNPIYGRDAQGNPILLQLGQGEAVPARLPEGVTLDLGAAAQARASGTAQGKWQGGEDQRNVGKERLSGQLKQMVGSYLQLDERGGIVNPDKGGLANLQARLGSSEAGQTIAGSVGSETQSIRRQITNLQPLLLQGIMQASGMGARAMDSNKELQFYLQAASDPTSGDIYSNFVAIDVLDKTYGLGNVLQDSLPPEVMARVQRDSAQAIQQRPIAQQTAQPQATPQGGVQPRQAPDGNFYIPDPNRPGKYLRVE